MHPALKATMATATIALLASTAGDTASARGRATECAHVGRQYAASGTLADGSTIVQVAGTATKRTSDDRYSGTLDVDVTQAPGRQSALGLHAYVVTNVRASGASGGELPDVGAKISLTGAAISAAVAHRCGIEEPSASATRAAAAKAAAAAAASVTASDDASDDDSADASDDDGSDDGTDTSTDDAGDDTTPVAAVVTGVEIKAVRLGHAVAATAGHKHATSGDDSSDDASSNDDSGDDDDSASDQTDGSGTSTADDGSGDSSSDDSSDDAGSDDDGDDSAAPAATSPAPPTSSAPAQPTSPAPTPSTTPAPTTPPVTLPGAGTHHPRR